MSGPCPSGRRPRRPRAGAAGSGRESERGAGRCGRLYERASERGSAGRRRGQRVRPRPLLPPSSARPFLPTSLRDSPGDEGRRRRAQGLDRTRPAPSRRPAPPPPPSSLSRGLNVARRPAGAAARWRVGSAPSPFSAHAASPVRRQPSSCPPPPPSSPPPRLRKRFPPLSGSERGGLRGQVRREGGRHRGAAR